MHYVRHLSKDEKLKKLIKHHGTFKLNKQKNLCLYLCYSIMSQQLSTKVARVIKQRFLDLYGGEPTPQQIIDTPFEKLRAIGLSNAKVSYVQNVARFEIEKGMDHRKLAVAGAMRVRVTVAGLAVGCPSRVPDSDSRVQVFPHQGFFQVGYLALFFIHV